MRDTELHITPEAFEAEFSLATAVTRLDFLSRRDAANAASAPVAGTEGDDDSFLGLGTTGTSLDVLESLELLALGEVIARKAHDSRLIGIRAALRGGADWERIAAAMGASPQQAWDEFTASIDEQLDGEVASAARDLAGARPEG